MRIRKITIDLSFIPFNTSGMFWDTKFFVTGTITRKIKNGCLVTTDICTKGVPPDFIIDNVKIYRKHDNLMADFYIEHPTFDEGINDFQLEYNREITQALPDYIPDSQCPECGGPQYHCPSGYVCDNGHGYGECTLTISKESK